MTLPLYDGNVPTGADLNKNIIHEAHEQEQLSVTTSSGSVSYSSAKTYHVIQNVGTSTAYINFDATATTSHFPLAINEVETFYGSVTAIHAITSAGTADLRIIGFGD